MATPGVMELSDETLEQLIRDLAAQPPTRHIAVPVSNVLQLARLAALGKGLDPFPDDPQEA